MPFGLSALDSGVKAFAQLLGDRSGLVVACCVLGGDENGSQIADVDLVDTGERRVGPVPPLGRLDLGQQTLGEGDQGVGLDLWSAFAGGPGVLSLDLFAHRGDTATRHRLGNNTLLFGQTVDQGLPVNSPRPKLLRLGACGSVVSITTRTSIAAIASAFAAISPAALVAVTALTTATTIAVLPRSAAVATATATATAAALAAVAAALGELGGDAFEGAARAEQLDALGLWLATAALGGHDGGDEDAVDFEGGGGADDGADRDTVVE